MAARQLPPFAHPVEQALALELDQHGIAWEYEPHEFVLSRDEQGAVREAFAPDFYLPGIGCYVECTVMRQSQTTRKNRRFVSRSSCTTSSSRSSTDGISSGSASGTRPS
jgi:hypothetical protein